MGNKYIITTDSEAKNFNRLLHSCWVDNTNAYYSSEEILKYYIRKENFPLIDTQQNNQISFYIGFSAANEDLIHLLIHNKNLKNKNYSLKELGRFVASDEGLSNILMDMVENIGFKNSSFDVSDTKAKKMFIQATCDYFVYNIETSFGDEVGTIKRLHKFIELSKCNFKKNEYQILHNLLSMDITNGFLSLLDKATTLKQQMDILNFQRNPLQPKYSEETEIFLEKLKLKMSLSQELKPNKVTTRKNKI